MMIASQTLFHVPPIATMHVFFRLLAAFGVGWLARMVEDVLTTTAWGGPFTILVGWIFIVVMSAFFAVAALAVGQLFLLLGLKGAWDHAGSLVLFLAVPPALVLAFSSVLGLREVEPVSNYSLMAFWPWTLCHFFIVFPIVNLPIRPRTTPPPLPGGSRPPEYDY